MSSVKKGDTIKVEYTGKLDDGTVFDSSTDHGKALEFIVGGGQMIKGFDDVAIGMKEGEEKEFSIQPSEAYGAHSPGLVQKIPREGFPKDMEIMAGFVFEAGLPNGQRIPATVVGVEEDGVIVDLNHPLAGKMLTFKIKVTGISS